MGFFNRQPRAGRSPATSPTPTLPTHEPHHGHHTGAYDNGHTGPLGNNHHNAAYDNGHHTGRHSTEKRGFGGRFGGGGFGKKSKTRSGRGPFGRKGEAASPYTMSTRPTFGQWLKHTALDIVTMAILGAIGLGVYFADPAPSRSFAITFSDGEIVHPDFAYPFRKEIIPIWAAAMLAVFVPIIIFLVMQIRVRSFWDVNNATIGLLYSLIGAAVFQVFIKWLIGGLRPHFLDVCKPDMALVQAAQGSGDGFKEIYFRPEICTGDKAEINDALESMPSGHTTAAFAGFVFLYLYLNAKLKVFSNYHPAFWKLIAIYAPILGACLIGGALTIDEYHNWYDVLAGAIIGTVFAFSSYRMVYASIWDWRVNHIPLNRSSAFGQGSELEHAVFTRKVGWGGKAARAAGGLAGKSMKHGHHNSIDGVANGGHHGHGLHNDGVNTHGHHNGMTGHNDVTGHHTGGLTGNHGHHNGGLTGNHTGGMTGHHNGMAHDEPMMGRTSGHYNDSSIPRRPVGAHTEGDHIV
jgi:diacylglycerol diphosphate phosphatase/phosphatidate phosphatase